MAALLCEELGKRVSLPGDETNKAVQWTISHKDVMYINDLPFVKLDPRSYTLLNLVRARNKVMDDGVVSLAGNLGLQSMINTRNAACDGAEKKNVPSLSAQMLTWRRRPRRSLANLALRSKACVLQTKL